MNMSDEIKVAIYEDGVKLSINLYTVGGYRMNAITSCLKRNHESKLLVIADTSLDKQNNLHFSLTGISKEAVPEFIKLIEAETLTTIKPTFVMAKILPEPSPEPHTFGNI